MYCSYSIECLTHSNLKEVDFLHFHRHVYQWSFTTRILSKSGFIQAVIPQVVIAQSTASRPSTGTIMGLKCWYVLGTEVSVLVTSLAASQTRLPKGTISPSDSHHWLINNQPRRSKFPLVLSPPLSFPRRPSLQLSLIINLSFSLILFETLTVNQNPSASFSYLKSLYFSLSPPSHSLILCPSCYSPGFITAICHRCRLASSHVLRQPVCICC